MDDSFPNRKILKAPFMSILSAKTFLAGLLFLVTSTTPMFASPCCWIQDSEKEKVGPSSQKQEQSESSATPDQMKRRMLDAIDKLIPGKLDPSAESTVALNKVGDLFLQRKFDEAKKALDAVVASDKTLPPSSFLLAGMLFAVQEAKAGVSQLEIAAKENPNYPSIYSVFARIAINGNRITDADALLAMMKTKTDTGNWSDIQKEQFEIEYLDALVDVFIKRQDFETANQSLERLAVLLPKVGKVQLRMAQIAFDQDKIDTAVQHLNDARSKDDSILVAPLIISNWFQQKQDKKNVESWITKASEEFPNDLDVQLNYATWLMQKAQYSKAAVWIGKAESNGAGLMQVANMKGQVAFLREQFDLAEMHFAKVREAQPANVDASNLLALSLVESGNADKMRRALEIASVTVNAQQGKNLSSVAVFGWVLFKNGDAQRASQQFSQVVNTKQMPNEASYFVAKFLENLKRYDEALRILDTVDIEMGTFLYRNQAAALKKKLEEEVGRTKPSDSNTNTSDKKK